MQLYLVIVEFESKYDNLQANWFENDVWKMVAIFSLPQMC